MTRILLADDDEALCGLLSDYLQLDNYVCDSLHRGDAVLPRLQNQDYDLLVLDIMLPGLQGLDVLRQMRSSRLNIPIIMLTARGDDMDRILGLELGADDYLSKPCNPRELSARIKAVLRRALPPVSALNPGRFSFGVFLLDGATRTLRAGDKDIKLTAREFDLLHTLVRKAGEVLTKDVLSEQVLKRPLEAFDRSLDMHVSHLRKKLSSHSNTEHIVTVRGIGYCFYPEGLQV